MTDNLDATLGVGDRCVGLFKIAVERGDVLPEPNVHMYLSWVLGITDDARLQKSMSPYVVESLQQLQNIISENERYVLSSNAMPYLAGKTSGAFHTSWNSLNPQNSDCTLAMECYSIAGLYAERMGKNDEASIFGLMTLDLDRYTDLLKAYRDAVSSDSGFKLDDKDFLEFKKYLTRDKRRIATPALKIDAPEKKLLI